MEKYSASYANTNNNFVLLNLQEEDVKSRLFSHYCVIKNILMRSSVTHPSLYLIEELGGLRVAVQAYIIQQKNSSLRLFPTT